MYANGHHRHHSDVTGMYSQALNISSRNPFQEENKFRVKKQLSSKNAIIREIFSPPSKVRRRRQKVSYDSEANYGHDSVEERSFDQRRYASGLGINSPFKHHEIENTQPRNYTSEGGTVRANFTTSDTETIHSLPVIQRKGAYETLGENSTPSSSKKLRLVHITPNEYNKRMNDIMGIKNHNVFKIPSQKMILGKELIES